MDSLGTLVSAARQGDKEAFGTIVHRFQDMAYAQAYVRLGDAHQAQDAAQEAFIDAYLSLAKLKEPAAFPGWFHRIVVKHADRQLRTRLPTAPPEVLAELPSDLPDPLAIVESGEVRDTIQRAIAALPESQRLAVTLFHLEGYPQKEVAEFLELPVSTVKKRLFDARKRLKERMSEMVTQTLQEAMPSRDDTFSRKVQFFVALKTIDLSALQDLLEEDPDLIQAKTEWDVAPDSIWPRGITPVFWAVKTGNEALLNFLLDRGADVNDKIKNDETPLHHAVLRGCRPIVGMLLEKGAQVNRTVKNGQTPLHWAVFRGDVDLVDLLLSAGAEAEAKDSWDRTAADWAALKDRTDLVQRLVSRGAKAPTAGMPSRAAKDTSAPRRRIPVGDTVLGRMLDGACNPLDGKGELADAVRQPIYGLVTEPVSLTLETGIKAVDLFAPIKRGGHVGFSPCANVGGLVLVTQIARNIIAHHNGRAVYLGLADSSPAIQYMDWEDGFGGDGKLLGDNMVRVVGNPDDPVHKRQQMVEAGLTMAETFRQKGHEVLLMVEGRLALTDSVLPFLRASSSTTLASITTLYLGAPPVGLEAELFNDIDAVIALNPERAMQGLYPAIDPMQSQSELLRSNLLDTADRQIVDRTRECLRCYYSFNYTTHTNHVA